MNFSLILTNFLTLTFKCAKIFYIDRRKRKHEMAQAQATPKFQIGDKVHDDVDPRNCGEIIALKPDSDVRFQYLVEYPKYTEWAFEVDLQPCDCEVEPVQETTPTFEVNDHAIWQGVEVIISYIYGDKAKIHPVTKADGHKHFKFDACILGWGYYQNVKMSELHPLTYQRTLINPVQSKQENLEIVLEEERYKNFSEYERWEKLKSFEPDAIIFIQTENPNEFITFQNDAFDVYSEIYPEYTPQADFRVRIKSLRNWIRNLAQINVLMQAKGFEVIVIN